MSVFGNEVLTPSARTVSASDTMSAREIFILMTLLKDDMNPARAIQLTPCLTSSLDAVHCRVMSYLPNPQDREK